MKKLIIALLAVTVSLSAGYALAGCDPFTQDCGPFHGKKKTNCTTLGCGW